MKAEWFEELDRIMEGRTNANPSTPPQLAALAELLGITPETHPTCFPLRACKVCERNIVSSQGFSGGLCSCGQFRLAEGKTNCLPCPFSGTPAADDVWLAPLMRWLAKNENEPMVSGSHVNSPCWGCVTTRKGDSDCDGKAYVYSLLHAALAARVSELIAIYPEGIPQ